MSPTRTFQALAVSITLQALLLPFSFSAMAADKQSVRPMILKPYNPGFSVSTAAASNKKQAAAAAIAGSNKASDTSDLLRNFTPPNRSKIEFTYKPRNEQILDSKDLVNQMPRINLIKTPEADTNPTRRPIPKVDKPRTVRKDQQDQNVAVDACGDDLSHIPTDPIGDLRRAVGSIKRDHDNPSVTWPALPDLGNNTVVKPRKTATNPKVEDACPESDEPVTIVKPRKTATNPRNNDSCDDNDDTNIVHKPGKVARNPKDEQSYPTYPILTRPGNVITDPKIERVRPEIPLATSPQPPVTNTCPPATNTQPPVTNNCPPVTGQCPPPATTNPPVTNNYPPATNTYPPATGNYPPVTGQCPPPATTYPPAQQGNCTVPQTAQPQGGQTFTNHWLVCPHCGNSLGIVLFRPKNQAVAGGF